MINSIFGVFSNLPSYVKAFNGLSEPQTFIIAFSSVLLFLTSLFAKRPLLSLVFIICYIGGTAFVVSKLNAQISPTEPVAPRPSTLSSSAKGRARHAHLFK
jgi:hypothetical protein